MTADLLDRLPHIPVGTELAVILSTLAISLAAGMIVLVGNWKKLSDDKEKQQGTFGAILDNRGSLAAHLFELRTRLIRIAAAAVISTTIAALITNPLIAFLIEPIGGMDRLIAISVTESFGVFFRVSLVTGLILASPYIIAQLWIFIGAGLLKTEQRVFYMFLPFASILFILGVAFAYFVMLPVAIPFLVGFMDFQATPTLENYIKFVTTALLAVGASFELPMVMLILAQAGIVDSRMLVKNWRYAVIAITILAAVVTPTPDPVNMGIVAAPLFGLYLLSVILTFFAQRWRKRRQSLQEPQSA